MKSEGKETGNISKARPNWFIDAKWVSGLVFMFIFGLTLFTFGLFTLTNEKNGIDIMTKMITLGFSRNGIDDPGDINILMQKIEAAPDKTIKPMANVNVTITKAEVEGKTPREIRLAIFRKVATPIYFNGKGAEDVLNTPEARAKFENDTFLLRFFSESAHKFLGIVLIILSAISFVLISLVVFFSYHFGRLANPGFVLVLTAWPWASVFAFLGIIAKNFTDSTIKVGENGDYGKMIGPFVREIIPSVAQTFTKMYLITLLLGLGLMLIAGLGKLFIKIKN